MRDVHIPRCRRHYSVMKGWRSSEHFKFPGYVFADAGVRLPLMSQNRTLDRSERDIVRVRPIGQPCLGKIALSRVLLHRLVPP